MGPIQRLAGIEGARAATGTALVIDTFRAFTTAAFLLDAGVSRLIITDTLDAARAAARSLPGAILCGEEGGVRPDDFDLGNSPFEVTQTTGLKGTTVVQRTSAGTRCAIAAHVAGAQRVFATSLVVASATVACADRSRPISIIASGRNGTEPVDEDDATGDLLAALLRDEGDPVATGSAVAHGPSADRLRMAPWAPDDDIALATDSDRFSFAMEVTHEVSHFEIHEVFPRGLR